MLNVHDCQTIFDEEKLLVDVQEPCPDDSTKQIYLGVTIAVGLLTPLALFLYMFKNRHDIRDRTGTAYSAARIMGTMMLNYRPEYCWFEVISTT